MSPEFGSTCAIFPIDAETLRYLEFTGRPTEQIELVDAYTREQGLFHEPDSEDATYTDVLELDLGDVVPSIAGPKRPQDRIALVEREARLPRGDAGVGSRGGQASSGTCATTRSTSPSPPRTRRPRTTTARRGKPRRAGRERRSPRPSRRSDAITVQLEGGETVELDHGHVVIAAITSCTNTSNPSVMLGAGPGRQEGGRARPDAASPG